MLDNPLVSYGRGVLIGRWVDKRSEDEIVKEKFIADYNEGKSNLQRTRLMRKNLLAPVSLAKADKAVRIGTTVQIVAPDVRCFRKNDPTGRCRMSLASTVPISHIDENSQLCPECPLLSSPNLEPVIRNTWRILGADGKIHMEGAQGVSIKFGEIVTIASATPGKTLYARSPKPAVNNFNPSPFGTPLHLSPVLDKYSLFRLFDVKTRDQNAGFVHGATIEPFTRVYINHVATNENLYVDDLDVVTFFGTEKTASVRPDTNRVHISWNVMPSPTGRTNDRADFSSVLLLSK